MSEAEEATRVTALKQSLAQDAPPDDVTDGLLKAHWHAGKGNYERARALLEQDVSKDAAWVRAHLHRRRGEHDEAGDWYEKAERPPSNDPLDTEWGQIAAGLLLRAQ